MHLPSDQLESQGWVQGLTDFILFQRFDPDMVNLRRAEPGDRLLEQFSPYTMSAVLVIDMV